MESSLVTCTNCNVCDLLAVVGNVFNFLLGLAFAVAVLFVVISGFYRTLSYGNKIRIAQAKSGLQYSIVGFCIVFVSWVFIHSFYQVIGYGNSNWWQINCDTKSEQVSQNNTGKKYSDLRELVPSSNLTNLVDQDSGIEAIDLSSIDTENVKQDLNLLKPGERVRFLTSYEDLNEADLNNYLIGLAGYPVENNDEFQQLNKKFQEAASFNMLDGGAAVFGEGEYADLTTDPIEENFNSSFDQLIERLKAKGATKILLMKSGNSQDNLEKCVDSGGDWVEFKNRCVSQKQICGSDDVKCTNVSNPYADCQCQPGYCLVNGKCEKSDLISTGGINPQGDQDEDGDGIPNKSDRCLGTPKNQAVNKDATSSNYGCSCSQITLQDRNCPSTRCEGTYLVTYPQSGKDSCSNGKVTTYSCDQVSSSYNATCDQTQNSSFIDKTNQIQQNSNLYNQLRNWLNQGSQSQGSGSTGSGSTTPSGSGTSTGNGNTGNTGQTTGTGQTGTGQTGTSPTGQTGTQTDTTPTGQTGTQTGTDTGSTYNPSSDLGKDGDFKRLAECIGFKDGEIPKNGALVGFYTDKSHTRMNVWYLDPRTGKAEGSNADTSGQQPLVTYPQGIGNQYGLGGNGIYAIQVQPHYSDDADTRESPLTARSDVKMSSSGSNPKNNWRINLHPGTSTAGCLGLGNRAQSDNFMRQVWTTVRGSEKPADYNDDLSQKKGSAYDKHRARDTVLFSTMDAGTCQQPGAIDNAIKTLHSYKGYQNYDPQMINYSTS